MTNFKFICSLYVIININLFQVTSGVDDRIVYSCSSSARYKANDIFDKNLQKLMKHLSSHTPQRAGFSIGSFREGNDLAYGHALCMAVSHEECEDCVKELSSIIRIDCPTSKNAIVGSQNCMLRYSDNEFFGQIDIRKPLKLFERQLVDKPNLVHEKLILLMHKLVWLARNQNMNAMRNIEVDESRQIVGSVHCTLDLLDFDCEKCLNGLIKELSKPDGVRKAMQIMNGSCILKYVIVDQSLNL